MFEPIRSAGRQARLLDHVEHRPWPLPAGRWTLGETLEDVLFAHWRVSPEELTPLVPDDVELDVHDGAAWVGIVVLRVTALRTRGLLPVPGMSSFLQLNVRTYVRGRDEKPGVWFLSLDASSRLAVEGARRRFGLPCFHARLSLDETGDWRDVECARIGERGRVFSGRYRPVGKELASAPGSLEEFLVERYCLYATDRKGRLLRGEIHHEPWLLRNAEAEIELATIAPLELPGSAVCHVAARQDLVVWPLEPIEAAKAGG
jgi:uncharacterized protein YqjF (DUF2071 family)